jgi:hypothetical protein
VSSGPHSTVIGDAVASPGRPIESGQALWPNRLGEQMLGREEPRATRLPKRSGALVP